MCVFEMSTEVRDSGFTCATFILILWFPRVADHTYPTKREQGTVRRKLTPNDLNETKVNTVLGKVRFARFHEVWRAYEPQFSGGPSSGGIFNLVQSSLIQLSWHREELTQSA